MNILVRLDDEREIAGPATVLAVGTTVAEYERVVNVSDLRDVLAGRLR